ncbi:unnamed protein product, partial [Brenthis ino]
MHLTLKFQCYASRRCREDGLWVNRRQGEASVRGWTNFTTCFPPDIQGLFVEGFNEDQHYLTKYDIARKSRYIEIIGYMVSCVAIIVSLYIFYTFRTLHNIRTLIHKHVFYSMLFQTVVCLIIFFDQVITRESIGVKTRNHILKGIDNTPNICEALYFIAEYTMSTIFSWVLVEGLHLNYLISNEALQPFNFKVYCLAAWVVPFLLTSIWAVVVWLSYRWDYVRVCWFGYNLSSSYWILQGPRLAVILCNAVILIRVLKMVIQKLKDARTPEIIKIKSTLDSTTPPTVEETTLSQDMRSTSVIQQLPTPYEVPLAVISSSEGLNFKQNKQSFVSTTSFTDIAFSRHIDSEVEDDENYESRSINIAKMEGDRNNNERRPRSWFHLLDSLICFCKNDEEEEDRAEGYVYYPHSQRAPHRGQQEVSVASVSWVAAAGPAINKTTTQRGQEEESVASESRVAGPAINKTRKRRLAKRRPRQIAVSPETPVINEE